MTLSSDMRPDPDVLLARVQAQERRAARGRLRIYFGASAGVGKTYAMLTAARELHLRGEPVLVGLVETHGRPETQALLAGLEVLPRRLVAHRGKTLEEFDLDAALVRHPQLVLVDELAHSNAPGCRHPKRWQDVEELLDAGIDVYTTVNVQHLESLNDAVGSITGIRVGETLPDTMFDAADEIILVDVPADELLARLRAGKVYQGEQAERAAQHFFRKGNLIALRELALRRTAERVKGDVQAYRVEQSIRTVWKTGATLLVCIGPHPGGEHMVRSGARLAGQLDVDWHAVYVETPRLQRLRAERRERILDTLKLARELGATTAVVAGNAVAETLVAYARSHNISRIVLGRGARGWLSLRHALQLEALGSELDVTVLGQPAAQEAPAENARTPPPEEPAAARGRRVRYGIAASASLATAALTAPFASHLELANVIMLFLLVTVLVAARLGRGPAVISSVLGVAAFDFFFVPPRFTFAVSDIQYAFTFIIMLAVGSLTAHLTASLRYQARVASLRETRSRALYEFARELSGTLLQEQIFDITRNFIQNSFRCRATILLPDAGDRLQYPAAAPGAGGIGVLDLGIAQWVFDRATPAGIGTDTLPASTHFYLPLVAPMRTRGVLVIAPESRRWLLVPEQRQHLETFGALAAIALERIHYIEVAQNALVRMESERLRNSLLAALSHDLRTPLTSLVGLSEALSLSRPALSDAQREMTDALHQESLRMSRLVDNLLDMARIESGEVKLRLEWHPVEEVVGSALRATRMQLAAHDVVTDLPADLPLVRIDAVLMERVLVNLLENAAKYTPPGSRIEIAARAAGQEFELCVTDDGPGLPPGDEEALFGKFVRGERESAKSGVGLGLAICRAIVQAHGGAIRAERAAHGARFRIAIPLGTPPAVPQMDELPLMETKAS